MPLLFDSHPLRKASDHSKPVPALLDRRRPGRPSQGGRAEDEGIASSFGKRREVLEEARLEPEFEAQLSMELDVTGNIVAQHGAPSGHGWATWRSDASSTFA